MWETHPSSNIELFKIETHYLSVLLFVTSFNDYRYFLYFGVLIVFAHFVFDSLIINLLYVYFSLKVVPKDCLLSYLKEFCL